MEMNKLKLLVALLFLSVALPAQKHNYLRYRDNLTNLSCEYVDSLTLIQTLERLENFDTAQISKNIHLYYKDFGWCNYMLFLRLKDYKYLSKAIELYDKALFHKPHYTLVLWDNSLCNLLAGNCLRGRQLMHEYIKVARKKDQDKAQIDLALGLCKD